MAAVPAGTTLAFQTGSRQKGKGTKGEGKGAHPLSVCLFIKKAEVFLQDCPVDFPL